MVPFLASNKDRGWQVMAVPHDNTAPVVTDPYRVFSAQDKPNWSMPVEDGKISLRYIAEYRPLNAVATTLDVFQCPSRLTLTLIHNTAALTASKEWIGGSAAVRAELGKPMAPSICIQLLNTFDATRARTINPPDVKWSQVEKRWMTTVDFESVGTVTEIVLSMSGGSKGVFGFHKVTYFMPSESECKWAASCPSALADDAQNTGCGGPAMMSGNTADDLRAQAEYSETIMGYMKAKICTRNTEVWLKTRADAELNARTSMEASAGWKGGSAAAKASLETKMKAELDSGYKSNESGCEALNMISKAVAVAKKQATCIMNRAIQKTKTDISVTVKIKQVNEGTVAGDMSINGDIEVNINASAAMKESVMADMQSAMETMLSSLAEQGQKATKGLGTCQTASTQVGVGSSTVNTASMKNLMNEVVNLQVTELFTNCDIEQINRGTVGGNMTIKVSTKASAVADAVVDRILKTTINEEEMMKIVSDLTQKSKSDARGIDTITGQVADVAKDVVAKVAEAYTDTIKAYADTIKYVVLGVAAILVVGGGGSIAKFGSLGKLFIGPRAKLILIVVAVLAVVLLGVGGYLLYLQEWTSGSVTTGVGVLLGCVGVYGYQIYASIMMTSDTGVANDTQSLDEQYDAIFDKSPEEFIVPPDNTNDGMSPSRDTRKSPYSTRKENTQKGSSPILDTRKSPDRTRKETTQRVSSPSRGTHRKMSRRP